MKYINADILRAEIKRLYEQNAHDFDNGCNDDQCYGYDIALSDLQRIIDALQQEQPEVDLEKIIEQTYHDGSVADTDDMDHATYENIARHFYELGLNIRKEEN